MNRVLVEIVADYALFLERVGEEMVPLETAVRLEEDLSANLQQLSEPERREFVAILTEIAGTRGPKDAEALMRLPEEAGIV